MSQESIERTLWYGANGRAIMAQAELRERTEPLIILGEAGMGKSYLLDWIAGTPEFVRCTARQLINCRDPQTLLRDAHVLVIDALDEVSSQKQGDAVDLVLRRLGELGYPRFVLSCRVADWRSATGLEAIREQYVEEPLELHLQPFDDNDAIAFLRPNLGFERAQLLVAHFNARGLQGFLGNPQTLELVARVAGEGILPETQGQLFERAAEVLRVEHRDAKSSNEVARETALDAAGAAFAGLILTGNEVVVRTALANVKEGELPLTEVRHLAGGEAIDAMLGTRLFKADGADRFTYWHRRIGEYLGACWLAKLANTKRKRRRLLALFHNRGVVPASLRGIHAWLARDPALALAVIAADPMGVIEYGDADDLTLEQGRSLLQALDILAAQNPGFRDWGAYSLRGIAQPKLLDDVRRLITAPATPTSLRLLVLQAINKTVIAQDLVNELRNLILDPKATYANRHAAGEALVTLSHEENWPEIVRTLHTRGDDGSLRLAIHLANKIGYESLDDSLIVDLIVAYAKDHNRMIGVLSSLAAHLPEKRIAAVLDLFAVVASILGDRYKRPGNDKLTEFAYTLIYRRVQAGGVEPERLWTWLEPFSERVGYRFEIRQQLSMFIRGDKALRRAVQRFVILERHSDKTLSQRAWRLGERLTGLMPSSADVACLLDGLNAADRGDERWRDIVQLVHHEGETGGEVRAAARCFAEHQPEMLDWLEQLAKPKMNERQVKEVERERTHSAEQTALLAENQQYFADNIEKVRSGDYEPLVDLAKVYLSLWNDISENVPAHERISKWIGSEISEAAHLGFEAFLKLDPPNPTAEEIADSIAQGQHWDAAYIIVAALAERLRNNIGFDDLSDERMMAGLFELRRSKIDSHAGVDGLEEAVVTTIQARGLWTRAMRLYHEPQLRAGRAGVDGLYALMRDDTNAELGTELASEWLVRFPDISSDTEAELIDQLVRSGCHEELRHAAAIRSHLPDDERRRNWDVVGLLVDFGATSARLGALPIEPELLWHWIHRTGARANEHEGVRLSFFQLEWIIATFRPLWPIVARAAQPSGVIRGNTNPWDANDYLIQLIRRLGKNPSDDAVAALTHLKGATTDGYTGSIQIVAAEQERIRVEMSYTPPSLNAINTISRDRTPLTATDLQAFMTEELAVVQAKVRSDDAESWRGFYYDDAVPCEEERCRDHLLNLLRQGSEGITLDPETHIATDKEVDIACSAGALRMPIEIKGQWHPELWHGADTQLDARYTQDWRADGRGIYLVLWFGEKQNPNKRLRSPGHGIERPATPDHLREMLTSRSSAAREGRVIVVVLDIER